MSETTTGIVVGDTIQLDQPLRIPDRTPVTVTVQPVSIPRDEAILAWERIQTRLEDRPIHGGGKRFTRDELHERH
ncbi:MAG TPA: hypothetical protein VGI40_25615 [Pirellulaceae bacterium]|jgi:hypothetical protein